MKRIGDWKLLRELGNGSYGIVYLAENEKTKETAAIKYHNREVLSAEAQTNARKEAAFIESLEHPHIINLYEFIETDKGLSLVLNFAEGGDLLSYMRKNGLMTESNAKKLFVNIVRAIKHAHDNGIIHRDIKLENILLDKNEQPYVADWGFASNWSAGVQQSDFVGSPHYMAPELLKYKPYIGPEIDVWSLGVVLYTLASGTMPFLSSIPSMLSAKIVTGVYSMPSHLSAECASLIKSMLNPEPLDRIKLDKVLSHAWMNTRRASFH